MNHRALENFVTDQVPYLKKKNHGYATDKNSIVSRKKNNMKKR